MAVWKFGEKPDFHTFASRSKKPNPVAENQPHGQLKTGRVRCNYRRARASNVLEKHMLEEEGTCLSFLFLTATKIFINFYSSPNEQQEPLRPSAQCYHAAAHAPCHTPHHDTHKKHHTRTAVQCHASPRIKATKIYNRFYSLFCSTGLCHAFFGSKFLTARAPWLGGAKPTILPGVGVALAARGSCSYRGWCIYYFFFNILQKSYRRLCIAMLFLYKNQV
jgi:hypothetical protein